MEQAGYTVEDGMQLIGPENLHILLRFVYKAEVLAGVSLNYAIVNLILIKSIRRKEISILKITKSWI